MLMDSAAARAWGANTTAMSSAQTTIIPMTISGRFDSDDTKLFIVSHDDSSGPRDSLGRWATSEIESLLQFLIFCGVCFSTSREVSKANRTEVPSEFRAFRTMDTATISSPSSPNSSSFSSISFSTTSTSSSINSSSSAAILIGFSGFSAAEKQNEISNRRRKRSTKKSSGRRRYLSYRLSSRSTFVDIGTFIDRQILGLISSGGCDRSSSRTGSTRCRRLSS
mmetsp:Transcript_18374/g.73720  ORF Transcript_18374/g.73720 Transcript_18374/m.73720 type:complete len:223 (+) Transcript_18374:2437-3105(+)